MNNLELLSDDENFLQLMDIIIHPRQQKKYRDRINHFEIWNDNEFRDRFRVSKDIVHFIVNLISEKILSETERNHALSPVEMVLLTLRFLATGSFLQVTGDFIGVDKSTGSRVVHKVTRAIASLSEDFIKIPTIVREMNDTKQKFYDICRFPRCIGAIDCTHIKIQSPGGERAENFRNRKGVFSINTQVICNADLVITNIVCRWPGASHDAHIFRNSNIKLKFENGNFADALLVGDSGYGVKAYMMTPLANPQTPAEHLYNEAQIRTRNVIERCFGVWKRRFPILSLGIRLNVQRVEAVVVCTAVLHNIARIMNDNIPNNNDIVAEINMEVNVGQDAGNEGDNGNERHILIAEYFQALLEDR